MVRFVSERDEMVQKLKEFLEWYNKIKPHMSFDWDNLEIPKQVFWKKCLSAILGSLFQMIEKWVERNNQRITQM